MTKKISLIGEKMTPTYLDIQSMNEYTNIDHDGREDRAVSR